MNLDSARALKQEIRETLIGPLHEATRGAGTARSLAMSAGAKPKAREPHRLLSVGIAPAGRRNVRLAVRVQRRALLDDPALLRIVRLAKQEVDLRYVGRIQKRAVPWYQDRRRPLLIGCSVGHFRITAGTLGCFVQARDGDAPLMLSNNHVLADENRGSAGDAILQPGDYDGGTPRRDVVGALAGFVAMRPGAANRVDAATATLRPRMAYKADAIRGLGKLAGVAAPLDDVGGRVAKVGRTTGLTRGRVTAFELDDVVVAYEVGNLRFDDQIEVESTGDGSFSDGGDSGSLIVNEAMEGLALLFAGSDQGGSNGSGLTYANPLPSVLESLKVDLLV